MPVKVNIGLTKKVGQQNYGSLGANCNVEFELDGGYDNGSTERFQDAVRRAYAACRQAVETELAEQGREGSPSIGGLHQSPGTNRIADQTTNSPKARTATTSQVRAIHAIANHNGVALAGVLGKYGALQPDDLSIGDASKVIDQLKSLIGKASATG